ncbi:MAG: hypothetical protein ABEN55_06825, partial [Bradymonadaceae bacterium]
VLFPESDRGGHYSLSVGVSYEQRLSKTFSFASRARYFPSLPTIVEASSDGPDRRLPFQHGLRLRTRLRWRLTPAFQPHLSLVAGVHAFPGKNTRSDRSSETPRLGPHASALLGFQSRWGADN